MISINFPRCNERLVDNRRLHYSFKKYVNIRDENSGWLQCIFKWLSKRMHTHIERGISCKYG